MVNKGFPSFGMSQAGAFVAALKNYNLPDFILALDTMKDIMKKNTTIGGRIKRKARSKSQAIRNKIHAEL